MGATVGPYMGLSEIGSLIVRKIANNADIGLVAKSTEEVIDKFEEYNRSRFDMIPGLRNIIVASMDIEKFYPSILSKESAKTIRGMWDESQLPMEIDMDSLSNYLGKKLKKNKIAEEGFEDLVYTIKVKVKEKKTKRIILKKVSKKHMKKKSKTQRKNIQRDTDNIDSISSEGADTQKATSAGVVDMDSLDRNINEGEDTLSFIGEKNKKKKKTEWIKPVRKPTEKEGRQMFGKALEMMLILCMDNHLYQYENKVRIQKQGGPIGLKLTGEIADCLMIDWDQKLLKKLETLDIVPKIYTRFKDDIEIITESLEKEANWKMVKL